MSDNLVRSDNEYAIDNLIVQIPNAARSVLSAALPIGELCGVQRDRPAWLSDLDSVVNATVALLAFNTWFVYDSDAMVRLLCLERMALTSIGRIISSQFAVEHPEALFQIQVNLPSLIAHVRAGVELAASDFHYKLDACILRCIDAENASDVRKLITTLTDAAISEYYRQIREES
jgi:hypothetical protein